MGMPFRVFPRPIWLVSIAVCCSLLPRLGGAVPALQESSFDVEGTIAKESPGKLTVDTGQGIIFRVVYDDKVALVKGDGSAGSAKDLKVGVKVHVIGELQSSGEIKAQRIEIEAKQAAPSGETPQPEPTKKLRATRQADVDLKAHPRWRMS
jgi:predicted NAD/FAD-binding protein